MATLRLHLSISVLISKVACLPELKYTTFVDAKVFFLCLFVNFMSS